MNLEQARFNMVEQQIRPWDVLNTAILDVLYQVRREDFIPTSQRNLAFVDMEIPLDHGEFMLSPKLEARLIQELRLKKSDRVLHIGTGSGYMAALLGHLAATVTTVEIHPSLATQAQQRLHDLGFANVTVEVGDGAQGWKPGKIWDVVLLSGSVPTMPAVFLDALAPGGCALAIVGDGPAMKVMRWMRLPGGMHEESLFETSVPPLHHAMQPPRFQF
ncbi:MAG: protein-L-isoaspartate O-methyltransferase [Ferrovum sp.]|nr:protein-L-isoaspartate O-methyltransferase [Ferrovum sp.]NDU88001.1 protein-L-isoaspartate O-methyltransferase [Ferrovum sp.]